MYLKGTSIWRNKHTNNFGRATICSCYWYYKLQSKCKRKRIFYCRNWNKHFSCPWRMIYWLLNVLKICFMFTSLFWSLFIFRHFYCLNCFINCSINLIECSWLYDFFHFPILLSKRLITLTAQQYKWLDRDLANVDRSLTPWLVATWHPPWYSSYKAHYREAECMRIEVEELLYSYGVDIVFNGHVSYPKPNK